MTAALPFVALGLNVFQSMQQNKATDAQAKAAMLQQQAQASANKYNQSIALQNAGIVDQQTKANIEIQDKQRRLRAGQSRASAASSGIGAESFGDIMRSNAAQEELDLLTIQSEGNLKSNQYRQQANLYGMGAQGALDQIPLIQSAAKSSKVASVISGASSGLQSYISISDQLKNKKAGSL